MMKLMDGVRIRKAALERMPDGQRNRIAKKNG